MMPCTVFSQAKCDVICSFIHESIVFILRWLPDVKLKLFNKILSDMDESDSYDLYYCFFFVQKSTGLGFSSSTFEMRTSNTENRRIDDFEGISKLQEGT